MICQFFCEIGRLNGLRWVAGRAKSQFQNSRVHAKPAHLIRNSALVSLVFVPINHAPYSSMIIHPLTHDFQWRIRLPSIPVPHFHTKRKSRENISCKQQNFTTLSSTQVPLSWASQPFQSNITRRSLAGVDLICVTVLHHKFFTLCPVICYKLPADIFLKPILYDTSTPQKHPFLPLLPHHCPHSS